MEFFKKRTNFRFMPLRSRWYAISGALIIASLLLIGIRGLNFGIDFTGGVVLELGFPKAADLEQVGTHGDPQGDGRVAEVVKSQRG